MITFAGHKYERVGVFEIKMRSLVQKLQPLEKRQLFNRSHLIASHCTLDKLEWRDEDNILDKLEPVPWPRRLRDRGGDAGNPSGVYTVPYNLIFFPTPIFLNLDFLLRNFRPFSWTRKAKMTIYWYSYKVLLSFMQWGLEVKIIKHFILRDRQTNIQTNPS